MIVVGDLGSGQSLEQLALGDTPNIAARLQDLAQLNSVVISERTRELAEPRFANKKPGKRDWVYLGLTLAGFHKPA